MTHRLKTLVAAAVLGLSATAHAGTINCPGTAATTDREFSLTTTPDAACLLSGNGNINGNGDAVNALGFTTLDKSDDTSTGAQQGALTITGVGQTSGIYSFDASLFSTYAEIALGFKVGNGGDSPDWAVFLLTSASQSVGQWMVSGRQSLSHANLYGRGMPTGGNNGGGNNGNVPEPASAALLALGAAGMGLSLRRRKAAKA